MRSKAMVFDLKTGQWFPAEAKIEKDKIIVWNDNVDEPAQVRYAFGNTIIGNVFSKEDYLFVRSEQIIGSSIRVL